MTEAGDKWANELMEEEEQLQKEMQEEFRKRLQRRLQQKIDTKEKGMADVRGLKKKGGQGYD